jgi:ferric-dicitrate binding protein FerR (iron transport regulator)
MEKPDTFYTDLISRYLYGDATPEDIRELETWVKSDPANAAEFSGLQKTWEALEMDRLDSVIDVEQGWTKVRSRISASQPKPVQINRFSLFLTWSLRVAAILLIAAIPTFFLYRYVSGPGILEYTAATGISVQTLPDGSTVTLNKGARLTCPSRFSAGERNVSLVGEACFEVAHDAAHPFVVAAGDLNIKVLGTTFLVNTATLRNSREVILVEGRVEVSRQNAAGSELYLEPGEKAETVQGTEGLTKSENRDPNFLAWKTRRIVFENTPLNEAAALLTQVYHKKIILTEPGLSHCRITATFDRQTLESVLHVFAATLDIQIRYTSAAIEISGRGCMPE